MSTVLPIPAQRSFALVTALALILGAMVPLVAPRPTSAVSPNIVISQIYGGGGNSGATYTHDFIELFNRGTEAVDVTGWSVQYASASGTSWQVTSLNGTIEPGAYYLVREAQGAGGTTPLPTPDASGSIAMSATSGKVALSASTTALTGSCDLASIVDFVGFGSANCSEGSATDTLSNTTAAIREASGCQDTDDNAADFAVAAPTPRNSASSANSCDPTAPTDPTATGSADPNEVLPGENTTLTVVVTPGTNPDSTDLAVSADLTGIGGAPDQSFTSTDGLTFTFDATVTGDTAPGLKSLPVSISDAEGRTGSATIGLTVRSVSGGGNVVISQVYGGGGNSGATLTHDFIELYNRTSDPISLAGWSVQYASAAGSNWLVTPLAGSIQPGGHYLVQLATNNPAVGDPLPTPDATGGTNMAAGSGKVALSTGTAQLSGACPLAASNVDFVGYGTSATCFEGSGRTATLNSSTAALRLANGAQDTNDNAADFTTGTPNPRNSGLDEPPPPGGECGDEATLIHEIQGSGSASPLVGQSVAVEGIVVGDFQNNAEADHGNLNGFYLQEEDADADSDPATSEGILVFGADTDVSVGDRVRVTGTVTEFASSGTQMTELTGVSVELCDAGVAVPAPTPVTLPVSDPTELERYEGMLVTFPQDLVISEYFNFDRFNEVVLTVDRQFQPTAVAEPGSEEADDVAEANLLGRITLDDGRTGDNLDPALHPNGEVFDLDNRFRGGDTLANVTGVIEHFGLYKVQPTEGADYTEVNPRPAAHDDVGGSLTVASFNVLNYFTTIDTGPDICGPAEDQDCRGADNATELERQRAKIVAALAAMDADVVGLIEIENHPGDVPTADLVSGLNDAMGAGTYAYVETGAIGTDAIRVALIYKPATVSPVGAHAILDSSVDERFDDTRSRPVLAQAFEETATGGVFTVAVNHLKSKGSACGAPDDDPQQGNCNGVRARAAAALADWLAADPTGSGDVDALIMGDLNAYDKEDPIDVIRDGGFTDLVRQFEGELAYSFLFGAQLGYLDHALASPTMAPQVSGATIWHINADEPDILDYDTSFKKDAQDALYEPNAYRSSDHDPVIVGLDLLDFGFDGLSAPIEETNVARAGSTVPVKLTLDEELDAADVLFVPAQVYACGDWPLGASDDAAAAGDTAFRYDPVDDQYVFNWRTDPLWAGTCKALAVTLQDGSYAIASFRFR